MSNDFPTWSEVTGSSRTIGDGTPTRRVYPREPESFCLAGFKHAGKTYSTALAFALEDSAYVLGYKTVYGVHGGESETGRDGAISMLRLLRKVGRLATYASDKHRLDRMVTLPSGERRRMCVFLDVGSPLEAKREAKAIRFDVLGKGTDEDRWVASHRLGPAKTVLMCAPHNRQVYNVAPEDVEQKIRLGYVKVVD